MTMEVKKRKTAMEVKKRKIAMEVKKKTAKEVKKGGGRMLREAERDVDHRHHPIILAAATTGTLQNDKQNCRQSSRDESEDDDEEKEEEEGNVTASDVSLGDESL